jgi:hypothetical protein
MVSAVVLTMTPMIKSEVNQSSRELSNLCVVPNGKSEGCESLSKRYATTYPAKSCRKIQDESRFMSTSRRILAMTVNQISVTSLGYSTYTRLIFRSKIDS